VVIEVAESYEDR